jgi:hypothetical protein
VGTAGLRERGASGVDLVGGDAQRARRPGAEAADVLGAVRVDAIASATVPLPAPAVAAAAWSAAVSSSLGPAATRRMSAWPTTIVARTVSRVRPSRRAPSTTCSWTKRSVTSLPAPSVARWSCRSVRL